MLKKMLLTTFLIGMAAKGYALTVYDPANHQQNMQNYQMLLLQKLEQVATKTENIQQTLHQAQMVTDNATNLEKWAGQVLGEESTYLVRVMDSLNTINENSQAILRDSKNLDTDFDNFYLDKDRLKNLDYNQLYNELSKISANKRNVLKDNLKTANTILEMNEQDTIALANYMSNTDGARGSLQAEMAVKKGIDHLNNRMARMADLEAKRLMLEAERLAVEQAINEIETEKAKRMLEMSEESKQVADEFRNRSGNGW